MKKKISLRHTNGKKFAGADSNTLVSVLVGSSSSKDLSTQLKKLEAINNLIASERPDIISDLSIYQSNSSLYGHIINSFPDFIVSTLPIYQCANINGLIDPLELLEVVQHQIESGVGFITIHPTPTTGLIELAQKRIVPWTSRGGSIVMRDLINRSSTEENVYLQVIDEIIKVAKKNNVVISIGASYRSANIFDSMDECQMLEFKLQKQIGDYIEERGVNVIVEGPGHSTPKKLIYIAKYYMEMGYPIMPLGPIPTDAAIGQDHIASSIGAAILGIYKCVDIITSVTREEHTGGVPTINSTIEAIRAAKITAHIIDLDKLEDFSKDEQIAKFRAANQTCIYGKNSSGCGRCLDVCPLQFSLT